MTLAATGASWRGMAALTVGTLAILAGARTRLAAPLVIGTATVVATVAVADRPVRRGTAVVGLARRGRIGVARDRCGDRTGQPTRS